MCLWDMQLRNVTSGQLSPVTNSSRPEFGLCEVTSHCDTAHSHTTQPAHELPERSVLARAQPMHLRCLEPTRQGWVWGATW